MGIYKVVQIKLPRLPHRRPPYRRRGKRRNISFNKAAILFFICLLLIKATGRMLPDKQADATPAMQEEVISNDRPEQNAGKAIFLKEILPFY